MAMEASLDEAINGPDCAYDNTSCACQHTYNFYDSEERVFLGLLALPVIALGLVANLTSVRVFTHRLMVSSSINWYLAVLSASDCVILLSSFFVLSLPRVGEYLTMWAANYISYTITPYMYGIMTTAQTMSVYMTVGVSIHRYIGVCHPYESQMLLPNSRVVHFISTIVAMSCFFNLPRFFEVHVSNVCFRENIDYWLPSLSETEMRQSDAYKLIFTGWLYTIFMFIVPFTLLIVLNTIVLLAVRKSRRSHSLVSGYNDELSKRAERKERQTSVMLISVVMLFLTCNSLSFIVNIAENIGWTGEFYNHLVMLSNFLVIINASCNICIYCLFSEKYRLLLHHYVLCECNRQSDLLANSVITS